MKNFFVGGMLIVISLVAMPQEHERIRIFLCGDVMTGRGIDQVLPYSVDPVLYESYIKDAGKYVFIAERKNGPVPSEVSYSYIWGDALKVLEDMDPMLRVINLETSMTTSPDYWKGKGIHYRMHPENVDLFTAAGIDITVLANNHVLDWGYKGLEETLGSLRDAGIKTAGAGMDFDEASRPAVFDLPGNRQILVFSVGFTDSGIPYKWTAKEKAKAGLFILPDFSESSIASLKSVIDEYRKEDDVVVLSVHWGANWGYEIPPAHSRFAHRMIDDAGVDLFHGHSSHHVKGMEIYHNKLIIYGAGDFINDYEGIGGHEAYRSDLSLMYFPEINIKNGNLENLKMVPMKIRRFSLHHADKEERQWMFRLLRKHVQKEEGFDIKMDGEVIVLEK